MSGDRIIGSSLPPTSRKGAGSNPSSPLHLTAARQEIHLDELNLVEVSIAEMKMFQRSASKVIWRPSPGRSLSFIITHNNDIIALLKFSSPVMNMRARDRRLNLSHLDMRAKGIALKHYLDISVCVGIQPLSWHWNLGKLAAMVATTIGQQYQQKYGDILIGVITTSVWGRSSQYNRVFEHIGYTSGFGHEHVTTEEINDMRDRLHAAGWRGSKFKHSRMAIIQDFYRLILGRPGDVTNACHHGHRRGIYYHPAVAYDWRHAASLWYTRWGLPRWSRTKNENAPYANGLDGRPSTTVRHDTTPENSRLFW